MGLFNKNGAFFVFVAVLGSQASPARAEYKDLEECLADAKAERDARICRQIFKNGAMGIRSADERLRPISDGLNLAALPPDEALKRLQALDVKYLFMADRASLERDTSNQARIRWKDSLHDASALSRNGVVQVSACQDGSKDDLQVLLNRESPLRDLGSYFVVKDSEQGPANITSQDAFTVGAWVKVNMTDLANRKLSPGYHQILAKGGDPAADPKSTSNSASQWSFKVTGGTAYLIVNRGDSSQNINFGLPPDWWGDTFGSCYMNEVHRECWHFVAIAVDPAKNDHRVVFLRGTYDTARGALSYQDYNAISKEDARTSRKPIPKNAGPLLLGAGGLSSFDGSMTGAFFARRALSAEEIKGIALYSAPKVAIRMCEAAARKDVTDTLPGTPRK